MSRSFDGADDDVFNATATTIPANIPLTMSVWFKRARTNFEEPVFALGNAAAGNDDYIQLMLLGSTDQLVFRIKAATAIASCVSPGTVTDTAWHHGFGRLVAANDRAVLLDGGNLGTNAATRNFGAALDSVVVGTRPDHAGSRYLGLVAHPAIWDVALTDTEAAMLAAGLPPLCVRPQSLRFFAPYFGRDAAEIDIAGGLVLTVDGAVVSDDEPPVWRQPRRRRIFLVPAGGTEIAVGVDELAFAGHAASIAREKHIAAVFEALELAGQATVIELSKNIAASTPALTLSEHAASLTLARHIATAVGQLTIAEQTAAARLSKAIAAQAAELVLAGRLASLGTDITIAAERAELALTEAQALVARDFNVSADVAALATSAGAATVTLSKAIAAELAELALTEFAAGVKRDTEIQADAAEISLSASGAVVNRGQVIAAAAAALELAAEIAEVNRGTRIAAAQAGLLLEGQPGQAALSKAIAAALATLDVETLSASVMGSPANLLAAVAQVLAVIARDDSVAIAPREDSAFVQPPN